MDDEIDTTEIHSGGRSKSNIKGARLSSRRRVGVACQIRLGCHTQVDASAAIPRVADGNASECEDEMVA